MSPDDHHSQTVVAPTVARLARDSGGLAMVALDQRESLRTLFEQAGTGNASDELLSAFKNDAAQTLAVGASAILLDTTFGAKAIAKAGTWPSSCALIVAADKLEQAPGEAPTDSTIDPDVDASWARAAGASALKLLLYWRGDENADVCASTAAEFLSACHSNQLLGIVEAIVRPPRHGGAWDREGAIVEAARALGACGPDIYKAEVPLYGKASEREIATQAEAVSEAVNCPWVVLSNGVPPEKFEDAVRASCKGGASGFLAGRAIWSDTLDGGDYPQRLRAQSLPRLERLAAIVDEHGRAWHDAARS